MSRRTLVALVTLLAAACTPPDDASDETATHTDVDVVDTEVADSRVDDTRVVDSAGDTEPPGDTDTVETDTVVADSDTDVLDTVVADSDTDVLDTVVADSDTVVADTVVADTVVADSDTDFVDTVVVDSDTDTVVAETDAADSDTADSDTDVLDTDVLDTVVVDSDTVVVDSDTVAVETDTADSDTDVVDTVVDDADTDVVDTVVTDTAPTDTDPPACTPDGQEPDSRRAPLVVDGVAGPVDVLGRTLGRGDVDATAFLLPAGCRATLTWTHDGGPGTGATWHLLAPSVDLDARGAFEPEGRLDLPHAPEPGEVVLALRPGDPGDCFAYDLHLVLDCTLVVGISPGEPTTLDDLVAAVQPGVTGVHYAWTADDGGAPVEGATVPADRTTRGQTWTVVATTDEDPPRQATAAVLVRNAPPVVTVSFVPLDPSGIGACAVPQCRVDVFEPDGDALRDDWGWSAFFYGTAFDWNQIFSWTRAGATWPGEVYSCGIGRYDIDGAFGWGQASVTIADATMADGDDDGMCDAADVCLGHDATGDRDGDGFCDDVDGCLGDDRSGDTDHDGVCDDLDACLGRDAVGDADADGTCDDLDPCFGDDASGDVDLDGLCADEEAAQGSVDTDPDSDDDRLDDLAEHDGGTDPTAPDSDGGGVPDGWEAGVARDPLDPADDAEIRLVFATSTEHRGDFGGMFAGDRICAARAREGGLGGAWQAALGELFMRPVSRFDDGGFVQLDGAPVASSAVALFDPRSGVFTTTDEHGRPITSGSAYAWTGFDDATDPVISNVTCAGWTSTAAWGDGWTSPAGLAGRIVGQGSWPTEHVLTYCATSQRLLCVEVADADADGLGAWDEGAIGTDPARPDTDGGGMDDGDELDLGLDPLDPADD